MKLFDPPSGLRTAKQMILRLWVTRTCCFVERSFWIDERRSLQKTAVSTVVKKEGLRCGETRCCEGRASASALEHWRVLSYPESSDMKTLFRVTVKFAVAHQPSIAKAKPSAPSETHSTPRTMRWWRGATSAMG